MESYQRSSPNQDFDRVDQLIAENQRLKDEKYELEQLNSALKRDKTASDENHKQEVELKDIEITMQKVTINHLRESFLELKTGKPYVPTNHTNNTAIPCGKVFQI